MRLRFLNDEEFKRKFETLAVVAEFSSTEEEGKYEALDREIAEKLNQLCLCLMDKSYFHQNYDWWPNRTRFIELSSEVVKDSLLVAIQQFLDDSGLDDWRVQLDVYSSLEMESEYIGPITVYQSATLASDKCRILF